MVLKGLQEKLGLLDSGNFEKAVLSALILFLILRTNRKDLNTDDYNLILSHLFGEYCGERVASLLKLSVEDDYWKVLTYFANLIGFKNIHELDNIINTYVYKNNIIEDILNQK